MVLKGLTPDSTLSPSEYVARLASHNEQIDELVRDVKKHLTIYKGKQISMTITLREEK